MNRTRGRSSYAVASVGGAVLVAVVAFAMPVDAGDAAAAEALFQAGKQLVAQQKYAEACPKFEASYKLDHTLGTLLNLADCHEKLGKIATAWAEWGDAADRAQREGDNRADFAAKHKSALADRLPKLQINVKSPKPGIDVFRDDTRLEQGMFDTPLPVDPGSHAIVVKRGDQVLKELKVDTAEGGTATVNVDIEAIEKAAPAPSTGAAGASTAAPGAGAAPAHGSNQKTIGLIVGGVGVAAIVGAAVLEGLALAKKPSTDDHALCVNKVCSPDGKSAADSAKTFADIGQWVGIGGIIFAAVGATLLITAPSSSAPPRSASASKHRVGVAPWIGPSSGGVAVGGHL